MFCGCANEFGAEPNTTCARCASACRARCRCSNREAVEFAISGSAWRSHCEIAAQLDLPPEELLLPDMPKNYQISQYDLPICVDG